MAENGPCLQGRDCIHCARTSRGLADYRFRSPLTTRDENFWDPLHYRVGIAADLARDLVAIASGGMPATGDASLKIHLRPGSVLPRR